MRIPGKRLKRRRLIEGGRFIVAIDLEMAYFTRVNDGESNAQLV